MHHFRERFGLADAVAWLAAALLTGTCAQLLTQAILPGGPALDPPVATSTERLAHLDAATLARLLPRSPRPAARSPAARSPATSKASARAPTDLLGDEPLPLLPSSAGRGPLPNRPPRPVRALVRLVEVRFVPRAPDPAPRATQSGSAGLQPTATHPVAPLAMPDDGVAWRAVRQALADGRLPDPARVRSDALVQAQGADVPLPLDQPVAVDAEAAPDPWRPGQHLLRLSLRAAAEPILADGPRTLIAVVDTSGSMALDGRLDHVKATLHALVSDLGPDDRLALVRFSDQARELVGATGPADPGLLHGAIEGLAADGASDQGQGLAQAWRTAQAAWTPGAAQRVVLFTDGEANLGVRQLGPLGEEAAAWAARGLRLDVVGVGLGEEPDRAIVELATRGGGRVWGLGGHDQAPALARDLAGAGQGTVREVDAAVAFSPALVQAWRQVGADGPAGEGLSEGLPESPAPPVVRLRPGQVLSVLYELALAPGALTGDLERSLAQVRLALVDGPARHSWAVEVPVAVVRGRFPAASRDLRIAVAAARFATLLRAPPKTLSPWAEVADLAAGPGARPSDLELARLIRQAGRLAERGEISPAAGGLDSRDQDLLDQRLLRAQHSLDPCATAARVTGRLELALELRQGQVVAATAHHDGQDGQVEACATEVARQWRFPSGWSASLEVPVLLAGR